MNRSLFRRLGSTKPAGNKEYCREHELRTASQGRSLGTGDGLITRPVPRHG